MDENGDGVAVPEEKATSVEPSKDRTRRPQRPPGPEILKKITNVRNWARRIKAKQYKQEVAARRDCDLGYYNAVPYDYGDQDQDQEDQEGKKKGNNNISIKNISIKNVKYASSADKSKMVIPKIHINNVKKA